MLETRNMKLEIISNTQKELNKRMKKWCAAESPFCEKRSIPNGDSSVFTVSNGEEFTINKVIQRYTNIFNSPYSNANYMKTVDRIVHRLNQEYASYAQSLDRDKLESIYKPIKFIFYGLQYIDENTVELQYGFSNIIEPVDNITFI